MAKDSKSRLIEFLKRRAWNPILEASPSGRGPAERKRLERVQAKTRSQLERYRAYGSAGQLRQEFQDDLTSAAARKVNADLKSLGLPIQADVAGEFFALADRLGVTAEREQRRPHRPHPPHPWHKKKPEDREKAKRELKRQAREGDPEALETLRTAPAEWAREYARELEERGGGPPGKSRGGESSRKSRGGESSGKSRRGRSS